MSDFENKIVDKLDQSIDQIPTDIRAELLARRQLALKKQSRLPIWSVWGGAVTAAVFAVVIWLDQPELHEEFVPLDQQLMVMSQQDFEIIEELEFYEWLAEEEMTNAG